jgi:GxxExxY protein
MRHRAPFDEQLTYSVIGAFFEVYNTLGPGFVEHLYLRALEIELKARGHEAAREVNVPVSYKGQLLGYQRLDMLVDDKLIIEAKSSRELPKDVKAQLYSYLKATPLQVGLILHFGPEAKFYRVEYWRQENGSTNEGPQDKTDARDNSGSETRT